MNSFKLEIYATDGCFYNGDCEHLVFGSADGSRGVMAGHEPMIFALAKGEIRYVTDGEWNRVAVTEGFVEVMPTYVRLFADTAVKAEEVDEYRARSASARAAERERQRLSTKQYINTNLSLKRLWDTKGIDENTLRRAAQGVFCCSALDFHA